MVARRTLVPAPSIASAEGGLAMTGEDRLILGVDFVAVA
jgi:hypothetical protein